ncbi:hypothetical protein [Brasilonema sennae]|nr:hypothetical protein [Brasilonema sennae]
MTARPRAFEHRWHRPKHDHEMRGNKFVWREFQPLRQRNIVEAIARENI